MLLGNQGNRSLHCCYQYLALLTCIPSCVVMVSPCFNLEYSGPGGMPNDFNLSTRSLWVQVPGVQYCDHVQYNVLECCKDSLSWQRVFGNYITKTEHSVFQRGCRHLHWSLLATKNGVCGWMRVMHGDANEHAENVALTHPSSHAHFCVLSFHSVHGDALLLAHCNLDTSQSSQNQEGSIGKELRRCIPRNWTEGQYTEMSMVSGICKHNILCMNCSL